MSANANIFEQWRNYTLQAESELRFEVKPKKAKVYVFLNAGFAEVFGSELVQNQKYEFGPGAKVAIFTYQGCVLSVSGKLDNIYVSLETPMQQYRNCHAALEIMRSLAEQSGNRGPITMVVGPRQVGKSTLCRILVNYAVRNGKRPVYVDIDMGQGAISIPGTIGSLLIDRPANVEDGFSQTGSIVYHYGDKTPLSNLSLYKEIISKMAQVILQSMDMLQQTKYSGIVINTFAYFGDEAYGILIHTLRAFKVDTIFVIDDDESLCMDLKNSLIPGLRIALLPKSCGVVERSKADRQKARDQRLKNYFYGSQQTPRYPFSFELSFQGLKLYKIVIVNAHNNKTKLMPVKLVRSLRHHIITVTFAESPNAEVIGTNVAGFICVTHVDLGRRALTVLSPHPGPLPNTVLLLSEIQFMSFN